MQERLRLKFAQLVQFGISYINGRRKTARKRYGLLTSIRE